MIKNLREYINSANKENNLTFVSKVHLNKNGEKLYSLHFPINFFRLDSQGDYLSIQYSSEIINEKNILFDAFPAVNSLEGIKLSDKKIGLLLWQHLDDEVLRIK